MTSIDDAAARQALDGDDPHAVELTGRDGVSVSLVDDLVRVAHGVKLDVAGFHFDSGAVR